MLILIWKNDFRYIPNTDLNALSEILRFYDLKYIEKVLRNKIKRKFVWNTTDKNDDQITICLEVL